MNVGRPDANDTTAGFDFGMTEIEERLRSDEDGSFRLELLRDIDEATTDLRKRIDAGLPPEEFAKANTLLAALAAAREIVVAFPTN